MNPKGDRLVSLWLFLLTFMVFGVIAGGGHARTIGAGFSVQSWHPFTGFFLPATPAQWAQQFALYQQTAQYQAAPMTLARYKTLFVPMFFDRIWARLMAFVLLVPLGIFSARRRISTFLALRILAIFAAGGLQAAFGWLLVLTGRQPGVTTPPPAFLAPHLLIGLLIFAALLWTALTVRHPLPRPIENAAHLRPWLNVSIALILFTATLGALVAATNAVTVYNTFPTMDGAWLPPAYLTLHPVWHNFLANQANVQFNHRIFATLTALTVTTTAMLGLRAPLPPAARDAFLALFGLIFIQYLLGMATIVMGSANLGYIHELNAVLLLAAAIIARHALRGAAPNPMYSQHIAPAE